MRYQDECYGEVWKFPRFSFSPALNLIAKSHVLWSDEMNPNSFQFKENILQFFSVHDDIWKKLQEFYYGQSPINEALAQLNKEDMSLFFEALSKNPARMMEMQWSWWQGQIQIYHIKNLWYKKEKIWFLYIKNSENML